MNLNGMVLSIFQHNLLSSSIRNITCWAYNRYKFSANKKICNVVLLLALLQPTGDCAATIQMEHANRWSTSSGYFLHHALCVPSLWCVQHVTRLSKSVQYLAGVRSWNNKYNNKITNKLPVNGARDIFMLDDFTGTRLPERKYISLLAVRRAASSSSELDIIWKVSHTNIHRQTYRQTLANTFNNASKH